MNLERMKTKTAEMIMAFSLPSILAMVLSSMITIVDGFFIGNYVGREGIAAVNLGLPILYLFLAVGIMVGVGGVAISGMKLGSGEIEESVRVFNQTVITTIMASLSLTVLAFVSLKPLMNLMGMASDVAAHFHSYYAIMIFVYPIMMLNASMGMFVRCEGKPQVFMQISIMTVLVNVLLDYLFIDKFGYGIEGVAMASLISVAVGLLGMVYFFRKKATVFRFRKGRFSKETLINTLLNGSSELIGQMSMSISMFAYNWVVMRLAGVPGVAAFTIIGYAAYLFNMVLVGFGQGSSPLISYAYGAKNFELSQKIRKLTNGFVLISGLLAMLILSLSADQYGQLFVQNENVEGLVRSGITLFMISFLFSGINTITSFYFTSIGRAKESALISASRGLVVLLLCIFTLPSFFGMTGVWLVAPVTEGLTCILSLVLISKGPHSNFQSDFDPT